MALMVAVVRVACWVAMAGADGRKHSSVNGSGVIEKNAQNFLDKSFVGDVESRWLVEGIIYAVFGSLFKSTVALSLQLS
jgi:hypothetical protein